MRLTIEVIGMEAILVTTLVLSPIESNVGVCEHFIGSLGLGRVGRNADAHGDAHFRVAERIGSRQSIANLRRQHAGTGEIGQICLQDGKLVAAQTADEIGLADAALEALADRLEQQIAGRMSERVIDVLEPVEIEVKNCEGRRATLGRGEGLAQPVDEDRAVGKPRKLRRSWRGR